MKPKDPIWNFYTVLEDDKKPSARCKDCNAEVSVKVLRLKSHREKCPGLSRSKAEKRPLETKTEPTNPTDPTKPIIPITDDEQPSTKRPKLQQRSVSGYGISTDSSMWAQLDEQIAK